MKLALEKWEPDKPLVLRMLAHELATGAEAVLRPCELAREGENVEGGRRSEPPKPEAASFLANSRWQTA